MTSSSTSLVCRAISLNRLIADGARWALAAVLLAGTTAQGQGVYPNRPIAIVIGYPAGGSVDAVGRAVADGLGKKLAATTVIENVGGAAGSIGVQRVVGAAPDGQTLIFGSSSEFVATQLLNPSQKYDAARDLVAIGYVGSIPLVLVASTQSGVKTLDQFVSTVKANPGKFSYGTSGVGSMLHFSGELVKRQGGLSILHIPYRGASGIASDLAGGAIEFAFLGPGAAQPFIEAGRIVPLAVTSSQRIPLLPSVPALGEHPALKGYDLVAWYALMAPRKTPSEIVSKLQVALKGALQDPGVRQRLEQVGVVVGRGDEGLASIMAKDAAQYRRIVEFAGMRE